MTQEMLVGFLVMVIIFFLEETHQYSLITGMTLSYIISNSQNTCDMNGTQDILVSSRKSLCPPQAIEDLPELMI